MTRTDAERVAWIDRQIDKDDFDRRTKEVGARLDGYPSVNAADLGRMWEREHARKLDELDYILSRNAPVFFGRRRWHERRGRLVAQLHDEYEQIRAAIFAGRLDKVSDIRSEFLVKEVYVVLRGETS